MCSFIVFFLVIPIEHSSPKWDQCQTRNSQTANESLTKMYSLNDITNGCVKVEPPDKTSYSGPRNQIPFTGDILVVKEEKTDTPWNGIHQETTSLSGVSDYQVPSLAEMSTQADVMNIQISNVQGAPSNQVVFSDKITGTQIEDNGSTGDGSNPEMQSKFDYVFQEKMPVVEQYHEGQLFKRMISQEKMYPVETGTRSPIDQSGFLKRIPLAETAEQEKELPHRINTQEGVSSPKLNHHAYADTSQTSFSTFPVSYQYSLPDEYQRDEATPSYQFDAGNGSPEIGVPYQINTTVTASSDKNSYTVPLDYQDTNMPASSDMNSHTAVPLNHTGTDMVAPSDMSYTTGTVNQKDANMSASSDMSSHTAVPLNHMGAEIVAPSDMSYMTVPVNHKDTSMSASSNMNSHTAVPLNHRKTNMPASSDMSSHTEVPLNHTGTNMVSPSDMSYTTVAVNHKDSNMFASSDMSYTTVAVNHKDANMFASSDMSSHTGVPLNHRETNMLAASDMSYTTVAVNHKDANMPASSDVSSRMAVPLNYTGTDMVAPSDMSYMTVPLYQRDTQEEMPASMVNNVRYQPASYQVEVSSYHGVHTPHESLKVQQVHQRQIYDVGPAKGQRGSTCCDCCCHSSPQSESYYLPTFGLESQRPSVIMVPVSWNNTASGISHMPLKVRIYLGVLKFKFHCKSVLDWRHFSIQKQQQSK